MLLSSPNAKELVCRVQVVSARGDSPAFLKRGFREKFRQHPSVGVLERLLAGEKARLTGRPVGHHASLHVAVQRPSRAIAPGSVVQPVLLKLFK